MNKLVRLLTLVVVALALMPMWASPARAAVGGPVILMGIDAEDGGPGGHGPNVNYQAVVNSMFPKISNGGSGILVIGGGKNGSDSVTRFWNAIAAGTGKSVTYVNGAAISTRSFAGFALLAVVSDQQNTPSGGLTSTENAALASRQADVAAFVNNGGGLLGFSATGFRFQNPGSYAYLAGLGTFTFSFPQQYSNINPTSEGAAIGITNALDVCCWHDQYETFPSFLRVLATNAATGKAAAIGGGNVVISDIQLAPLSATKDTGTSHTVTATVKENNVATSGKAVTFTVISGPHAGMTSSDTTDSTGEATFTYTGSNPGLDTVEASFVDSANNTQTSNRVTVEWLRTNTPPVVSAGGPYQGFEGTPVALDGDVSDADNDPLTISWSYGVLVGVDSGASCTFSDASAVDTTISCTDDGEFYVTLTASDGVNPPVSDSMIVLMLDNVAPVAQITGPDAGSVYAVGTPVNFTGSFTEQGTNDTHTAKWTFDATDYDVPVIETPGSGTVNTSQTFTAAGVYSVKLTVTDDDGLSGVATTVNGADAYVVVYDPDAGFVTGGGWINSPAGAYAADPALTGRANFGFVSKYQKGATTPTGETEFQFKAGNLNFHSASYEWLVVSGAKAQYKGVGTINGSGDYGFLLTATDGQVNGGGGADKFRIKIWNRTTGSVVYDNQMGAADGADPSTVLGGGSIVIHSK